MSVQAWFTLATLLVSLYVLARDLFSPAATLLTAVVVLLTAGVVSPAEAFSGFSNPAPITVAALYVLAGAVQRTGALQPLLASTLNPRNGRHRLARLLLPTAAASAFLNNTPIVATLAPQVARWAERSGESPSRFLMPLSFAAILGGVVTLIGTSTNVVVSGLLESAGEAPFGMFELTPMGLPVALGGLAFLVLGSGGLLIDRKTPVRIAREQLREFVVNMDVEHAGPLDGISVEAAGLRHLEGVYLVEINRDRDTIAPVSPETTLHGGDRLTFVGRADLVVDLQHTRGLVSSERAHLTVYDQPGHTFFEAVVGEASPLIGETLKGIGFRGRYQAAVIGIHRAGRPVAEKFGEVELRIGDTLLLLSDPGFSARWRDRNDFLLVSRLGGAPPAASKKAWIVALVTIGIVIGAGSGALPVLQASLIGALLLVIMRVLTPAEARASVDLDVIIVIAAAFGLGAATESSGLAQAVARVVIAGFDTLGPTGILLGLVLTTLLLTEMITNNAAAVLVFPIAASVAADTGLDLRVLAISIAIAASASFLTPIGYQTNTMVYGMGGYRFGDYARLGLPLTVLVVAIIVLFGGVRL